ncbi:LYR family of Fe/S cluster biogenesis protein [Striga hermonthica]|uniref:LYR family of Fe/S cluster biogenesis protein n=1 Tax=Striga hermonthica TaxID=68872 RepID=A0A9N7NTJ1_STRHE|nr:LYR family of Fe/S cluster biogenesis protein [Striga hermonthica]
MELPSYEEVSSRDASIDSVLLAKQAQVLPTYHSCFRLHLSPPSEYWDFLSPLPNFQAESRRCIRRFACSLFTLQNIFTRHSLKRAGEEETMGASGNPRLSGMQKQVLALYRGFLRAARAKSPEERTKIESIVSAEFRHNSTQVDRKNFLYIEYLVRRGKKQLDQLKSPDTVGLTSLNIRGSQ